MNKRILLIIGLLSLALLLFWGSTAYTQSRWTGTGWQPRWMMGNWNGQNPGPGMMNGGMMGNGMGGWGYPGTGTPIAIDQAVEAVERSLAAYGSTDLMLTEVMEFSNHFYAEVEEKNTGTHAFELLIDRYTGAVYPEPGPNMMWNTKYGHMGGWWSRVSGPLTVTPEQARSYAQQWLDANLPGTTLADEADAFYGYYTIHVLRDGRVSGMLSVNGYTGQIWYHNWHSDFIGMQTLEE
jgi:hypothetical protein